MSRRNIGRVLELFRALPRVHALTLGDDSYDASGGSYLKLLSLRNFRSWQF
jgi:hypothetical protein